MASLLSSLSGSLTSMLGPYSTAVVAGVAIPASIYLFSRFTRFMVASPTVPKSVLQNAGLKGKVIIVTGCSAGIGLSAAKFLYESGAHVIMATRDEEKTKKAMKKIEATTDKANAGKMTWLHLDLKSLNSVKNFVEQFRALNLPLHVLVNNAGVGITKRQAIQLENLGRTEVEQMFQINYLGHFLLTELLIEDLTKTKGQVVAVSSTTQSWIKLQDIKAAGSLSNLVLEKDYEKIKHKIPKFESNMEYPLSKAFNTMMIKDMSKRYQSTGIRFYSMCPGLVETEFFSKGLTVPIGLTIAVFLLGRAPDNGAQTILHVICEEKARQQSGYHYARCAFDEGKVSVIGKDDAYLKELRDLSVDLVKQYLPAYALQI